MPEPGPADEPIAQPVVPDSTPGGFDEHPDRIDTAQLLQIDRELPARSAGELERLGQAAATVSLVSGLIAALGGLFSILALPFAIAALVFAGIARRNGESSVRLRIGWITGWLGTVFAGVWLVYYSVILSV